MAATAGSTRVAVLRSVIRALVAGMSIETAAATPLSFGADQYPVPGLVALERGYVILGCG